MFYGVRNTDAENDGVLDISNEFYAKMNYEWMLIVGVFMLAADIIYAVVMGILGGSFKYIFCPCKSEESCSAEE